VVSYLKKKRLSKYVYFLQLSVSSLNVGYFGEDKDCLKTNWNSEYFEQKREELNATHLPFPVMLNYEIAPNSKDSNVNIVSKHCVLPPSEFEDVENANDFYSCRFYYHFNQ
jgi:hypothetical protein